MFLSPFSSSTFLQHLTQGVGLRYQERAFSTINLFSLGPPLSDFLNNPVVAPTTKISLQRSSVAAPGTRSAGVPLKHSLSEIGGADAKPIKKSNRPAAAYLTNRNSNNDNSNDLPSCNQNPGKHKLQQDVKPAAARDLRMPGEIIFLRSRMFYSRPAYNARREVMFGLRHMRTLIPSLAFFSL